MQQLSGKNRDLTKAQKLLSDRTKELNDKEAAFAERERELLARQKALEEQESTARAALAAKEREVENIRNAVTKALTGFTDKGLKVETRDGKVYVSMESKLMFASASWEVSDQGKQAVKELAKVLEENPDLDILVEGHTDNDAYKGRTDIKDNWDLSVMRATAILKLILQYGPKIDPARIEACGHGEYAPKVENSSAANKAQNRRTEIILTPKLSEVLNIVR
jgi:chemotaxis protein MotB